MIRLATACRRHEWTGKFFHRGVCAQPLGSVLHEA
jgi:hypothetical protein